MTTIRAYSSKVFVAALCLLAIVLASAAASAAGRVQWKKRKIEETGSGWKIEVTMHLSRAPDVAHVPMKFSFKPVVYYERTLVDGKDEPIIRKVPLHHRQPLVESVDVGFLDPGTGKIENRTRFSFRVTRAHGFEAGEYQVTIRNARSGGTVGGTTRITFEGENEVIDRRSIVFTGEKKKKKGEEEKEKSEEPVEQERELGPEDDAFWEGGPVEGEDDPDGPPSIEEKPGGCGCRLGPEDSDAPLGWLGTGLAFAVLARRRRSGNARGIPSR